MSAKTVLDVTNVSSVVSAAIRKPNVDFSKPSPLVTIVAGKAPHSKCFAIHQGILSFYSPFFATAPMEGQCTVELTDVDVEIFGLLSHWLYTQEIRLPDPDMTKKTTNIVNSHLLPLSKLWILAQRCEIPVLQNTVMNFIVKILDTINMVDVTTFIMQVYMAENTRDTPIRALVIHHASQNLTPELMLSIRDFAPRELLFDMAMAFTKHNDLVHNGSRYELVDANKYHVGIPEVEDEMLDEELNDLDCEDPDDERDDESILQEHFRDDTSLVAEEVLEMIVPCGDEFHEEDGADVEQEELLVDYDSMGGFFE